MISTAGDIVGFPEPRAARSRYDGRAAPPDCFDLVDELRRVRETEAARLADIAGRLLHRFGPETAAGFLYFEIRGRAPDGVERASLIDRLRRAPSAAPAIVEEMLGLADSGAIPHRR